VRAAGLADACLGRVERLQAALLPPMKASRQNGIQPIAAVLRRRALQRPALRAMFMAFAFVS
jgi:hypothetical protein